MAASKPFQQEQVLGQTPRRPKSALKRFASLVVLIVFIGLGVFMFFKYFYVVGDGVKSGHLNFAVRKGYLFKTFEGKLIQDGFKVNMQSNEFEFSIKSKKIYDILSVNSGKIFDLHYKEYSGAIPWRGNSRYVVDSILSMR